uniref:C-type lectin domain-containing protein n=1 Tax=Knipowitschia caucasica TaxID=637954 RepID=A0AAV2LW10_KNICA
MPFLRGARPSQAGQPSGRHTGHPAHVMTLIEGSALVHCVIVYKYINLEKTWDDAREYCREHHKDLATVENTEEVKKLPIPSGHTAWIGLFDDPASWKQMTSESNSWRWSSTRTTSPGQYQNWFSSEPQNAGGNQLCVFMQNGFWADEYCTSTFHFVCYRVQPSGLKEYFRITSLKSWSDSQSYCRQNYQDLATIQTSAENQAVKDLLPSSSSIVWIGLYRVSWRWSDGSPSTFRWWSTGEPGNSGGSEHCGVQTQTKITLQTTANMCEKTIRDKFLRALEERLGPGFSVKWHRLPTRR